ncbi:MAG: virulence factor [Anaerolineae bacterium]|nr:virulence factor [Anaerolineae bacterium]
MARYQILYWEHIPLGVKATDVNGTVRENLPQRFQDAVEKATARGGSSAVAYTSMFKWGKEHEREGAASEVASAIAKELDDTWNEEEALAMFENREGN